MPTLGAHAYYVSTLQGHGPNEALDDALRRCRHGLLREVFTTWAPGAVIRHLCGWNGKAFVVDQATDEERVVIDAVAAEPTPKLEGKGIVFIPVRQSGAAMAGSFFGIP